MKRIPGLLRLSCLALVLATAAGRPVAAQESPVLAQDLKTLRAPGKIAVALWTRRPDSCTLQLVTNPPAPFGARVSQSASAAPVKRPKIQAWLIRADGSYISSLARHETSSPNPCLRCRSSEVTYTYPRSASDEAVAVSISVDGVYYIQQLASFGT
jgi:hypothetical protein